MLNEGLSYNLPEDPRGKVKYLLELMKLSPNIVSALGEAKCCEVLTGIVLYHHLPPGRGRSQVLEKIYAAPGPIRQPLLNKITDPIVNPIWGIWSLKTEDLFKQYEYFDSVSQFGSAVGITFSASSGYGAVKELVNRRFALASAQTFIATVLAWGFFWNNDGAKATIREEIFRRAGKKVI
jgi:hypothetical protein